jgi:hypothetical protein
MRQRLVTVLKSHEEDTFAEVALRCFWSLAKPLPAEFAGRRFGESRVIDLADWARARCEATRV